MYLPVRSVYFSFQLMPLLLPHSQSNLRRETWKRQHTSELLGLVYILNYLSKDKRNPKTILKQNMACYRFSFHTL